MSTPNSLGMHGPALNGGELGFFVAHALFMIILVIGVVLLIVWMAQNLKGKQLLIWAGILLGVGLLGGFITFKQVLDTSAKLTPPAMMNGLMPGDSKIPGLLPGGMMNGGMMGSVKSAQPVMPTFKHVSMMPTFQTLSKIDADCATDQCSKDIDKMMMEMKGEMDLYLKNSAKK